MTIVTYIAKVQAGLTWAKCKNSLEVNNTCLYIYIEREILLLVVLEIIITHYSLRICGHSAWIYECIDCALLLFCAF